MVKLQMKDQTVSHKHIEGVHKGQDNSNPGYADTYKHFCATSYCRHEQLPWLIHSGHRDSH